MATPAQVSAKLPVISPVIPTDSNTSLRVIYLKRSVIMPYLANVFVHYFMQTSTHKK